MKRLIAIALLILALLGLCACGGKTRVVHCDGCGKEIQVDASSDLNEDAIFLCEDCQKLLYSEP